MGKAGIEEDLDLRSLHLDRQPFLRFFFITESTINRKVSYIRGRNGERDRKGRNRRREGK